jgi:molybdopterin-guanine dinucleotide biosynthesis protein A
VVTGVVLAGGASRRFGRDKAREKFHGKRLIDGCVEALRELCDPVLVVANDLSLYYDVAATLVRDFIPQLGPLGGIYTALLYSPHDWAFVKATDMPFLVPELFSLLCRFKEEADAVVPVVGEYLEPLLAIYHRRCLPAIAATLQSPDRKVVDFYPKVRFRPLPEEEWRQVDAEGRSFWNVNTPEDWERLIRM